MIIKIKEEEKKKEKKAEHNKGEYVENKIKC